MQPMGCEHSQSTEKVIFRQTDIYFRYLSFYIVEVINEMRVCMNTIILYIYHQIKDEVIRVLMKIIYTI